MSLSGQKRTRDEFSNVEEANATLSVLCRNLKSLDSRTSTSSFWYNIQELPYETVDPRNALYIKPKCIIKLENAPDGLPHLFMVDRTIKVSALIENHLGSKLDSLRESIGEEFCNHISSIERTLHTKSTKTDIYDQYFLPDLPINRILGPTVLARLLDGKSPRAKLSQSSYSSYSGTNLPTPFYYSSGPDYSPTSPAYCPLSPSYCPVQHTSTSPAFAPIHTSQLEAKEAQLAKRAWLEKQSHGVFLAIDIGAPETHSSFESSGQSQQLDENRTCYCYRKRLSSNNDDPLGQLRASIPFLREDISSIVLQTEATPYISLDIRRILLGFSLTAKIIDSSYHKNGKVHCDLTPTNILVLEDTFLPIDSMDIPIGSVAPGGTLEWSAPEQILYRPVSEKTDVYSLALMVVALLGGIIFGQISEYVVASKPQSSGIKDYSLNVVKLIAEPELSLGSFEIEHENSALTLPVDEIRNTLRRCLLIDPNQRPTILELSESLMKFAELVTPGPECVLTMKTGFGDGKLYCWINEEGVKEYFWKTSYSKNRL